MFDAATAALEKILDLRMRAHEIHASNIANANVPEFKARKIDFDRRMQEALEVMDPEAKDQPRLARERSAAEGLESVQPDIYEDPLAKMNSNGNTVNAEREQAEVAKNTLAYEAALQMLNRRYMMEKLAIDGGGR